VGASPEKLTVAGTPPIVTSGVARVVEWIVSDAGAPVAGVLVTLPRPLQKMVMNSPI
jgi:hypothetical protein